ncbi:DUF397 domain-containing protein [Streptomyces sp. NPDC057430]|uniref:DUF397 domain-containing protein n=1 Tax=unclassified Streptomyces TaxID=2593676 RepID=UPI0036950029
MNRDDLLWFKSSYSGGSGTECVEAAALPSGTAVRDSKAPDRAPFSVSGSAWSDFLGAVREGHMA